MHKILCISRGRVCDLFVTPRNCRDQSWRSMSRQRCGLGGLSAGGSRRLDPNFGVVSYTDAAASSHRDLQLARKAGKDAMRMALTLAATLAMMLVGSNANALIGDANKSGAVQDRLPTAKVTCPGAGMRDRCPPGYYLGCTPDKWCACISCFAFRRYPRGDDYYWYRWRY